jgi:hypothetical protein
MNFSLNFSAKQNQVMLAGKHFAKTTAQQSTNSVNTIIIYALQFANSASFIYQSQY